ncbi:MAG TPA: hypothetical protein VK918_01370 [Pyrinomonadaceae bacterium]|nr:hypothetical protein [Pyrinomonadaceae bacterium]
MSVTSGFESFWRNVEGLRFKAGDPLEELLLREYGAVFAARGVVRPDRVLFDDEGAVRDFQERAESASARIGGYEIVLQRAALEALLNAIGTARGSGLDITPRGADSSKRSYEETVELWNSRVEPALVHWVAKQRLSEKQADEIRGLAIPEQIREVLRLENERIYFAKDLSKSIIYSVAPPGTSQHLAMLAFDISEHGDASVREILTGHGWFQTVTSDLPHFTYLGANESELPGLGLKRVEHGGRAFWVPDI